MDGVIVGENVYGQRERTTNDESCCSNVFIKYIHIRTVTLTGLTVGNKAGTVGDSVGSTIKDTEMKGRRK
jgi:hypothetical protein